MFEFSPAITALLTFAITEGIKTILKQLGAATPSGWVAIALASFVGALLVFGQGLVGSLDPTLQQLIVAVLTVLAAAGGYRTAQRLGSPTA